MDPASYLKTSLFMVCASFGSPCLAADDISPPCRKAGNELMQLRCSTALSRKTTKDYQDQIKAAEARQRQAEAEERDAQARIDAAKKVGADADRLNAKVAAAMKCFAYLKQGTAEKRFNREEVISAASGRLTIENACTTAVRYGYRQ